MLIRHISLLIWNKTACRVFLYMSSEVKKLFSYCFFAIFCKFVAFPARSFARLYWLRVRENQRESVHKISVPFFRYKTLKPVRPLFYYHKPLRSQCVCIQLLSPFPRHRWPYLVCFSMSQDQERVANHRCLIWWFPCDFMAQTKALPDVLHISQAALIRTKEQNRTSLMSCKSL